MKSFCLLVVAFTVGLASGTDPNPNGTPAEKCVAALQATLNGDHELAERLWQEEVDRCRFKPNTDDYASAAYHLGVSQMLREKYPQAESSLRSSLTSCRSIRPKVDESLVQSTVMLHAQSLIDVGRFKEAELALRDWWAFWERDPEMSDKKQLKLLIVLAHLYHDAGFYQDAERCCKGAIARSEAADSDFHLSFCRRTLANIYLDSGKLDDAKKTMDKTKTQFGSSVELRVGFGWYYLKNQQHQLAIDTFEAVLKSQGKLPIHFKTTRAELSEGLGLAYAAVKDFDRAKHHLAVSLSIYAETQGHEHPNMLRVAKAYSALPAVHRGPLPQELKGIEAKVKKNLPNGFAQTFSIKP